MEYQELREEIVALSRRAYARRLFAGTSGNLSAYLPEAGLMLITPTGVRYETMRPEQVVAMTPEGEVLGGGQPSSEWRLHAALYAQRPEARAVFHTHSPAATAFAAAGRGIPNLLIEMELFLGGEVPCAAFARPGSPALGQGAAQAMQGRNACLLARHGVAVVGESLEQAYLRAEYVEDAAEIAWRALCLPGARAWEVPEN